MRILGAGCRNQIAEPLFLFNLLSPVSGLRDLQGTDTVTGRIPDSIQERWQFPRRG